MAQSPTWSQVRVLDSAGVLLTTYPNSTFPTHLTITTALDTAVKAQLVIDNIAAESVRLAYETVPTASSELVAQAYTFPGQLTVSGALSADSLHGNGQALAGLVSNVYISGSNLVVTYSGEELVPTTITTAIPGGSFVGLETQIFPGNVEIQGNLISNGILTVANGTTTDLSICFTSEADTGFYHPTAGALGIVSAGTETLRLTSANLVVTGDITAFGSVSDARLKRDIRPLESALAIVNALEPVEYVWNDHCFRADKRGTADVGFIAQNVANVVPLASSTFVVPGNTTTEYLSVKHERLIPYLVGAIKELTELLCKHS